MSLGRILVLLLGLVIVAFVVKTQLAGTAVGNPEGPTQQKRQLDNVRNRAQEIQKENQNAADELEKKTSDK